jgi:hypothetical protein
MEFLPLCQNIHSEVKVRKMYCEICPEYPLSEAPIKSGKFCKVHSYLIGSAWNFNDTGSALDMMTWWHEWTKKYGCKLSLDQMTR